MSIEKIKRKVLFQFQNLLIAINKIKNICIGARKNRKPYLRMMLVKNKFGKWAVAVIVIVIMVVVAVMMHKLICICALLF